MMNRSTPRVDLSRVNFNNNDSTIKNTTKPTLDKKDSAAPASSTDSTNPKTSSDDTAKQKGKAVDGVENQQAVTYHSAAINKRNIKDATEQATQQTTTSNDAIDYSKVIEAIDQSTPKEELGLRKTISDVNRVPDFLSHTNDLTGFGNQHDSGRQDIARADISDIQEGFRNDSKTITDRWPGLVTPGEAGMSPGGPTNPIDQLTGTVDGSGLVGSGIGGPGGPNVSIAIASARVESSAINHEWASNFPNDVTGIDVEEKLHDQKGFLDGISTEIQEPDDR